MQPPLEILQRWMQSVITDPRGVERGLESPEAKQILDVGGNHLESVIEPSRQLTSHERLAIYANAYYQRLVECLESDFPIFRDTVGEDAFVQFAMEYLQRYPSQSYTLGRLSEHFPRFLDESKPAAGDEHSAAWADFLVDLATLEQTLSAVFDGPGVEGQGVIALEQLHAIESAKWPHAKLHLVPCLRLLAFRFPANRYYTAAKQGNASVSAFLDRHDCWLAISRRDFIVRRFELNRSQFELLRALARGETVGDAILAAADTLQIGADQFASQLESWFRDWTAAPFFAGVDFG